MDTRPLAAGVALLAAGTALADPPARLRLAGPPPFARAAAPDPAPPTSWGRTAGPVTVRPLPAPIRTAAPPAPSLLGAEWAKLKTSVLTPAAPALPVTAAPPPAAPDVYASKPAYRWYGWGAMAPNKPPAAAVPGSKTWLAQTGATPGAFPAVAASAAEPAAAPVSALPPVIRPAPVPVSAAPLFRPDQPVSQANLPPLPPGAVLVSDGPTPPVFTLQAAPTFAPAPVIVPASAPTLPVPPVFQPLDGPAVLQPGAPIAWLPAAAGESVTFTAAKPPVAAAPAAVAAPQAVVPAAAWVPVTRGQAPDFAPPLDRLVKDAAFGLATVTAVRFPAPGRVVVELSARTAEDARGAAAAVSRLAALKPLAVEFAATVTGR